MRTRTITLAMVAAMAVSTGVTAQADGEGPSKVWICHFEDHEAGSSWDTVEREALDGDYVLAYGEGMPLPSQIQYCETGITGSPVAGNLLLVSVNAVDSADTPKGHRVQLMHRIDGYIDGYKG